MSRGGRPYQRRADGEMKGLRLHRWAWAFSWAFFGHCHGWPRPPSPTAAGADPVAALAGRLQAHEAGGAARMLVSYE